MEDGSKKHLNIIPAQAGIHTPYEQRWPKLLQTLFTGAMGPRLRGDDVDAHLLSRLPRF
jgi:hypothetical protein